MEITSGRTENGLELTLKGRLDASWADHLSSALEEAIRGGNDRLRIDMAAVAFMSSAGIRVLVKFYKQLQRINGSLAVSRPSEAVCGVLDLAGLGMLLEVPSATAALGEQVSGTRLERAGGVLEVFEDARGAHLTCRVVGEPELLSSCTFAAEDCHVIRFAPSMFGLGLGALGASFADCRGRFGEFLAVAGAAAYLPTDGAGVPDYVVSTGALVPELSVLYALVCEGAFSHLIRFEASAERGRMSLSDLVVGSLEIVDADVVGMVAVAESAGLVGAALRRSPALEAAGSVRFGSPEIRDWLSLTTERAYGRSLVVAVGVAARKHRVELDPFLRPIGRKSDSPAGHFHAAAFSYRAFERGRLDLRRTVASLFEAESLEGVLHLLSDDREISGVGESEFVRGACWIGPLAAISRDGASS
jgi:anti-anti-sigma factor